MMASSYTYVDLTYYPHNSSKNLNIVTVQVSYFGKYMLKKNEIF